MHLLKSLCINMRYIGILHALYISMNTQNKVKKVNITWDYKLYTETIRCSGFAGRVWNLDIFANGMRIKSVQRLNKANVLQVGIEILKILKK